MTKIIYVIETPEGGTARLAFHCATYKLAQNKAEEAHALTGLRHRIVPVPLYEGEPLHPYPDLDDKWYDVREREILKLYGFTSPAP